MSWWRWASLWRSAVALLSQGMLRELGFPAGAGRMWVVTPGRAGTDQRVCARAVGVGPHCCSHRAPHFLEPFSVGQLLQLSCRCSFPMWEEAASPNVSGNLEAASTARHRFASMRALPRCSTLGSFPRCHCFSHCPPLLGAGEALWGPDPAAALIPILMLPVLPMLQLNHSPPVLRTYPQSQHSLL